MFVSRSYGQVADNLGQAVGINPSAAQNSTTAYQEIERGPHHSVFERVEYEQTPYGAIPHRHTYTALATGMHYRETDANGNQVGPWLDSQETIEILPRGGARAVRGQQKAFFPSDIYDGIIRLVTPDGGQFVSQAGRYQPVRWHQ